MIELKRKILSELLASAKSYPIVTVLGPRQAGKTTLVKMAFPEKPYVSVEDPDIRSFAIEDPRGFLEQFANGAIIDEIQRVPTLLSYLQGIVDSRDETGLFILTGSHQFTLQQEVSQSLAGRTGILHLLPFSLGELASLDLQYSLDKQMFTGFYPRIYKHDIEPQRFYRDYTQTYLERDVKLLVNIKDLDQFQRFLQLIATQIGQLVDYTRIANDLGISRHTIKSWLSILQASYIMTTLPPYFTNLGKRIIKSPKIYFNDVGLACYLLGIRQFEDLQSHPLRGYLFENLVVNEVSKILHGQGEEINLYFYRDSNQLEVDLLFQLRSQLLALEIKSSQTFKKEFITGLTKFNELAGAKNKVAGYVIYAGQHQQKVKGFEVINYEGLEQVL